MNKLGFYVQSSQGVHDHITNVQPPVLLLHAWDQGLLEEIRRFRSPDTLVIGRMDYIIEQGTKRAIDQKLINAWLDGPNPADRGRAFADHILTDNFNLGTRRENGRLLVDAWMSLNECIPGPASEPFLRNQTERKKIEKRLRAYDAFQAAFRNRLMEHGVEAVAFNFAAGNFTHPDHYIKYFPKTLASYTYLGFHEYGWPAMHADLDASALSSAGSYRPIVAGIQAQTGRNFEVVITEAGLARMFAHPKDEKAGDVGWLYESDPVQQDAYWRSLEWYNDYLVQDENVVGACLFQVGHGARWETFRHFGQDAQGQPIRLLERIRKLRDKPAHPSTPTVPLPNGKNGHFVAPITSPDESPSEDESSPQESPGDNQAVVHVSVAEKLGIDANRPIDPATGAIAPQVADPSIIGDLGVGWVRLNFVLGQRWESVAAPEWQNTYRSIIQGFRDQGLKIYGLISDEAVSQGPGDRFREAPPPGRPDDPWIQQYAETFATIVRAFQGDVSAYESFNEPDDWHDPEDKWRKNWIHPAWFAAILQAVYDKIKGDPALRKTHLISGPLQGLHINENAGAAYLRRTYEEGKTRFGWGTSQPFPFDGIGYHVYVAQDPSSNAETVREKCRAYLEEVHSVIRTQEGADRPVYLSEFGWTSNNSEDFQEMALRAGLDFALKDPGLALVIWFCTQDFADPTKRYGLYREGDLSPAGRKRAYHTFKQLAEQERTVPVPAGAVHGGSVPVRPPSQPVSETVLWKGWVTASDGLNLRAGPSTNDDVLETLGLGAAVQVLKEGPGDWLLVEHEGRQGYVSGVWVDKKPPQPETTTPSTSQTRMLRTWIRFKELLKEEAKELGIDPAVALAVLLAESAGEGFAEDGRMIIRFETHIFLQEWGERNRTVFDRHFRFDPKEVWKGHMWRPKPEDDWRSVHASQDEEWAALTFARSIMEDPALRATAMGAPQIMGFNHVAAGYQTPGEMFRGFQMSEEEQIRGLFRFIANSGLAAPLQQGDMLAFAQGYNGAGNAVQYRNIIQQHLDAFERVVRPTLVAEVPVQAEEFRVVLPETPLPAPEAFAAPEVERMVVAPEPVVAEAATPSPGWETPSSVTPAFQEAWTEHVKEGLAGVRTLFEEASHTVRMPYKSSMWLYRVLLALGIGSFLAAIGLAYLMRATPTASVGVAAVFGALSLAAFLSLGRSLQSLMIQAQFVAWLAALQNTYWARLMAMDLSQAPSETPEEINAWMVEAIQELLRQQQELD